MIEHALVLREVRRLAARGCGIVLSTHEPDHAFACGTRVALLHESRLAALGPPAEVLTAERLPSGQTLCAPDQRYQ